MGNQWLFRFRPNDSYSGRVIADYGVNTLGKKKWAVLHSTDAFGTAGGKALASVAREARRASRSSIRAMPTRARTSRRSCLRSSSPAPTSSAPTSPSRTITASSRGSCASSASTFPGSARPRWSTSPRSSSRAPRSTAPTPSSIMPRIPARRSKAFGKAYREPSRSRRTTRFVAL